MRQHHPFSAIKVKYSLKPAIIKSLLVHTKEAGTNQPLSCNSLQAVMVISNGQSNFISLDSNLSKIVTSRSRHTKEHLPQNQPQRLDRCNLLATAGQRGGIRCGENYTEMLLCNVVVHVINSLFKISPTGGIHSPGIDCINLWVAN